MGSGAGRQLEARVKTVAERGAYTVDEVGLRQVARTAPIRYGVPCRGIHGWSKEASVSDYDAWEVLEIITLEMDLVHNATAYPWRLRISPDTYSLLKDFDASGRPQGLGPLFFQQDGHEYIRPEGDPDIPYSLNYRVVVDGSLAGADHFGTVVELDDVVEPAVQERQDRDWDALRKAFRRK